MAVDKETMDSWLDSASESTEKEALHLIKELRAWLEVAESSLPSARSFCLPPDRAMDELLMRLGILGTLRRVNAMRGKKP
jgi:hypothetical protein